MGDEGFSEVVQVHIGGLRCHHRSLSELPNPTKCEKLSNLTRRSSTSRVETSSSSSQVTPFPGNDDFKAKVFQDVRVSLEKLPLTTLLCASATLDGAVVVVGAKRQKDVDDTDAKSDNVKKMKLDSGEASLFKANLNQVSRQKLVLP